jgi:hypothetical protein
VLRSSGATSDAREWPMRGDRLFLGTNRSKTPKGNNGKRQVARQRHRYLVPMWWGPDSWALVPWTTQQPRREHGWLMAEHMRRAGARGDGSLMLLRDNRTTLSPSTFVLPFFSSHVC